MFSTKDKSSVQNPHRTNYSSLWNLVNTNKKKNGKWRNKKEYYEKKIFASRDQMKSKHSKLKCLYKQKKIKYFKHGSGL